ncbi:uncharacterized protein L3040_007228 [Drepanopeziza brunnea f. sp. 'multigermtubi']|uniref:uncharacterized protein n=1 Tax=Drepanopeziza brunnea f. sp. 'multigermtubi' TaxID=698441 RepID=UPI00238867AA|nr:hypothetical protein L3040_007228 [Drepanopeziza brunnea f. sp. 'multigermtubi']
MKATCRCEEQRKGRATTAVPERTEKGSDHMREGRGGRDGRGRCEKPWAWRWHVTVACAHPRFPLDYQPPV